MRMATIHVLIDSLMRKQFGKSMDHDQEIIIYMDRTWGAWYYGGSHFMFQRIGIWENVGVSMEDNERANESFRGQGPLFLLSLTFNIRHLGMSYTFSVQIR